jgi:hypothetical protein
MARLFADEDFPRPTVAALRALGHDVVTVAELGRQGLPDAAQLSYATADDRAVLTHNRRHFLQLHRRSAAHAGIVVCTRDPDDAALAARIHQVVTAAGPLAGQCLRVNRRP